MNTTTSVDKRGEGGPAPHCPRCGGFIPSNEAPGSNCGALSRAEGLLLVCSACGLEEALEVTTSPSHACTPVDLWPVPSDRSRV